MGPWPCTVQPSCCAACSPLTPTYGRCTMSHVGRTAQGSLRCMAHIGSAVSWSAFCIAAVVHQLNRLSRFKIAMHMQQPTVTHRPTLSHDTVGSTALPGTQQHILLRYPVLLLISCYMQPCPIQHAATAGRSCCCLQQAPCYCRCSACMQPTL